MRRKIRPMKNHGLTIQINLKMKKLLTIRLNSHITYKITRKNFRNLYMRITL